MRGKLTTMAAILAAVTCTACTACTTGTSPAARTENQAADRTAASEAASAGPAWHAGSRTQALAYARHLLAGLRLPPGTRPVRLASLPALGRGSAPPGPGWAGLSETLQTRRSPRAVLALLDAGPPFRLIAQYGAVLPDGASAALTAPAPGITAAVVNVAVLPYGRGGTLIAAHVYAAWLPYRTAGEHLDPANYRSVTASVTFGLPQTGSSRPMTFTSPVIIKELAALLNASAPENVRLMASHSCLAISTVYTLTFTPKPARGPVVVVRDTPGGCGGTAITVDGKAQPSLWDAGGRLSTTTQALLGNPRPAPVSTGSLASPGP